MKIAIVADWLTNYGGAESVISAFHELYPDAPIFTTIYKPEKMRELGELKNVRTTWLNKIPFAKHQWLLGQMPVAVEMMNLDDFDVVLSSCHSVSKGIITKPSTLHISYCHTPMRYAWENWDLETRMQKFPRLLHPYIRRKVGEIRKWDSAAAQRVDQYIANSNYIASKIKEHYNRESNVIYPPVRTEKFKPATHPKNDYYFSVGRLIPYKKFDLLIETFNQNGLPLKIAGTGSELENLKRMAGANVEILGYVSDEELAELYANCKAFLFPQMEDAGIVPLEAMSAGRPVIAYDKGGSLDTMIEGKTGLFFEEQSLESLNEAIIRFEKMDFDSVAIRKHAQQFDTEVFKKKIADYIQKCYSDFMT
jgi:glycosyltransferase involved in cell wall biosynthesis